MNKTNHRVCNLAAMTSFAPRQPPMTPSMRHFAVALMVATSACYVSAFTFSSFGTTSRKQHAVVPLVVNDANRASDCWFVQNRACSSSRLYAKNEEGGDNGDDIVDAIGEDNGDKSQIGKDAEFLLEKDEENEEDDDDEDEEDAITQRLRRNAVNSPINPMKEHDKMMKDNQDEAQSNTSNNVENVNVISESNISKNNVTLDEFLASNAATLYPFLLAQYTNPDFDTTLSVDENFLESQFRELLSRQGDELSRLGPGIATLPLDPSSEEAKVEDRLSQKETALQEIIDEAESKEDGWNRSNLEEAAKIKAEIEKVHFDDCGAVLLSNLAFYDAFSSRDIDGMKDVWWHSASSMCIHPSHPPLIGCHDILESFDNIFLNGVKSGVGIVDRPAEMGKASRISRSREKSKGAEIRSNVFMTPTNIRGLSVRGTTASLVCDEDIYSKMNSVDSVLVNKLLTTNVFRKVGGKWKMTHRHASWHPETLAARKATKAKPGFVEKDDKNGPAKGRTVERNRTIQKFDGKTSTRRMSLPSIPSSLEGLDANAVLGLNKKEDKSKKSGKGKNVGIGKEAISLSDLLGGAGGGMDSGLGEDDIDDKGIADVLADIFGGAESDSKRTGSGTPEDPFVTRRIIKIGPEELGKLTGGKGIIDSNQDIDDNDDYDDDDDDDDDDDENADEVSEKGEAHVIDLRGKSEEERKKIMADVLDVAMKDAGLSTENDTKGSKKSKKESSVVDVSVTPNSPPSKESLRQKCIATIRKLSEQGLLSPKQKRVLLTDIITSSANGQTSVIEIAYEILCTGNDEFEYGDDEVEDVGVEDFTEQCRVFAEASLGDEDDR